MRRKTCKQQRQKRQANTTLPIIAKVPLNEILVPLCASGGVSLKGCDSSTEQLHSDGYLTLPFTPSHPYPPLQASGLPRTENLPVSDIAASVRGEIYSLLHPHSDMTCEDRFNPKRQLLSNAHSGLGKKQRAHQARRIQRIRSLVETIRIKRRR